MKKVIIGLAGLLIPHVSQPVRLPPGRTRTRMAEAHRTPRVRDPRRAPMPRAAARRTPTVRARGVVRGWRLRLSQGRIGADDRDRRLWRDRYAHGRGRAPPRPAHTAAARTTPKDQAIRPTPAPTARRRITARTTVPPILRLPSADDGERLWSRLLANCGGWNTAGAAAAGAVVGMAAGAAVASANTAAATSNAYAAGAATASANTANAYNAGVAAGAAGAAPVVASAAPGPPGTFAMGAVYAALPRWRHLHQQGRHDVLRQWQYFLPAVLWRERRLLPRRARALT